MTILGTLRVDVRQFGPLVADHLMEGITVRMKILNQTFVLFLLLTLSLAAGCGSGDDADSKTAGGQGVVAGAGAVGSKQGDMAPDFTLARLDGGELTLSDLRGKVVIVDFWDTWCPPCRVALPHLQELSETYRDDLVVVGLALGKEGPDKVRSFTKKTGLTFEMVLWNQDPELLKAFGGIQSIPTTFLIDADGVIRQKWVGGLSKATYENAVVAAINGQRTAG